MALCDCSGGGGGDAGPRGTDGASMDAACAAPDGSTPSTSCDPFDGGGCGCAQSCVWKVIGDQRECRSIAMPQAFEQPCDMTMLNCQPGFTCVQLRGDSAAKCYKVCDPMSGMGCSALTGMSPGYACSGLRLNNGSMEMFGLCTASGISCSPLADTCPSDQTCTPMGTATGCAPSGPTAAGGDCTMNACQKGLVCIPLRGAAGPVCFKPCAPNGAVMCSNMSDVCLTLTGVGYGICRTPVRSCDPVNDVCPADQNCTYDNIDLKCAPSGTTMLDGDCTSQPCARGGVCVDVSGSPGPRCYQACDPTMPMRAPCPPGKNCATVDREPFGICTP